MNPGGKPVVGEQAEAVARAVLDLETLMSLDANQWKLHWFHGKGLQSLGKPGDSYDSFKKAYDLEPNVEAVPRELAGVCLELGKFDEAVSVAGHAASIAPDKAETLGNWALAQLMAGQVPEAKASNTAALQKEPEDRINLLVRRVIDEVASGARPQPTTLGELTKAAQPKKPELKKPFWKFW